MRALRLAGRVVPLIVLSSCSGGAAGSQALAAGLAGRGADRVIAMLAPVTDSYATALAGQLYRQLAAHPELTAGRALARARVLAEDTRPREKDRVPVRSSGWSRWWRRAGTGRWPTRHCRRTPLAVATTPPGRAAGAGSADRGADRAPGAVARGGGGAAPGPAGGGGPGAAGGVVLTGIGGIGKTALAGRVMARLADEGWLVAVHEGRWSPTALIARSPRVRTGRCPGTAADPGRPCCARRLGVLADPGDEGRSWPWSAGLLAERELLVVLR